MTQRKGKSAAEFFAELDSDEEYQRGLATKCRQWLEGLMRRAQFEVPLMRELIPLGFEARLIANGEEARPEDFLESYVESTIQLKFDPTLLAYAREVDKLRQALGYGAFSTPLQLTSLPRQYDDALPILDQYIDDPLQEDLNAEHIRLFATKGALPYWDRLKEMYTVTNPSERPKTKEALALALTEIVEKNKEKHFDELVELLLDKDHGVSRKQFTHALERSKRPESKDILAKISDDPDIANNHLASIGRAASLRYIVPNERFRDVQRREKKAKMEATRSSKLKN